MRTHLSFQAAAAVAADWMVVLAVNAAKSQEKNAQAEPVLLTRDEALLRATKSVLSTGEFRAEAMETLLVHAPQGLQAKRLLILGLGKADKANAESVRKAAGAAVRLAKPRSLREATLLLPDAKPETLPGNALPLAACVRAAVEGAIAGDFDPDTYRSERKNQSVEVLALVGPAETPKPEQEQAQLSLRLGRVTGEAQTLTRSLVNEPGNKLTPTEMGRRAKEMCKKHGLLCEVYSTEKIQELNMGAFWSVSQGSAEPPALIVMTYEPEELIPGAPVLGLVGKGITFDTGGISIKPADNMEKMKYDMAGGAAMIGAMQAIAQLQPKCKVIGIVCAAENMPGGKAQKPGDVQTSMSGKTIEIINTYAEGRLVLADGLAYAKQLGATRLIDAATLTGACVVALGYVNAGAFANDEDAYAHFQRSLQVTGERFWRLPLDEEYRELIVSQIADIKNTGGRWGGAVTAAMFLKEFVGDTPWIHLDIAGTAWIEEQKPWIAAGPSGIAMRSILEWVRSYDADAERQHSITTL